MALKNKSHFLIYNVAPSLNVQVSQISYGTLSRCTRKVKIPKMAVWIEFLGGTIIQIELLVSTIIWTVLLVAQLSRLSCWLTQLSVNRSR